MNQFTLTSSSGDAYMIEGETSFGRGTASTVRLDDSEVSRKHATISLQGDGLIIKDEGSANGTFVNGKRIEGTVSLRDGDEIRLGKTVLKLQVVATEDISPTVLAPEEVPALIIEPEPEALASTQISDSEDAPKKRSKLPLLLGGCGALVIAGLCLLVVLAISGIGFLQDFFGELDIFTREAALPEYTLSEVLQEETVDDRPEVISYLGLPDAFTISAITMEGVPVRVETWRYFAFQMRVDFVDGEATWTMDIEPAPEDTILPAWYDPLAFELGMSMSEVAAVAASASPAGQMPEAIDLSEGGDDLVGSTMLAGDQIMIGLDPSGVVYVETIALFPEGEGGS